MLAFFLMTLGIHAAADAAPDPEIPKLQATLVKTLESGVRSAKAEYEAGRGSVELFLELAKPLLEARLQGKRIPD